MPNGRFSPVAKVETCSGFPSALLPAKNLDLARRAVGHEEVAVRGHANLARLGEAFVRV